jgi:hypothetical protein
VTGPTPGSVSSSSSVAELRCTGWGGAPGTFPGPPVAALPRSGDDHLLSVRYRCGEIDELERRLRLRTPGGPDRIVHATSVVQTVEAGLTDGSDDVHEQLLHGSRLGAHGDDGGVRSLGIPLANGKPTGQNEPHEERDDVGERAPA